MKTTPWWRDVLDHDKAAIMQIIESVAAGVYTKRDDTMVIAIAGRSALGKSASSYQLARYIGRPYNVVDLDTFLIPRAERELSVKLSFICFLYKIVYEDLQPYLPHLYHRLTQNRDYSMEWVLGGKEMCRHRTKERFRFQPR